MRKDDRATTARACFIGRDPRRVRAVISRILDGARNIILAIPKSGRHRNFADIAPLKIDDASKRSSNYRSQHIRDRCT